MQNGKSQGRDREAGKQDPWTAAGLLRDLSRASLSPHLDMVGGGVAAAGLFRCEMAPYCVSDARCHSTTGLLALNIAKMQTRLAWALGLSCDLLREPLVRAPDRT